MGSIYFETPCTSATKDIYLLYFKHLLKLLDRVCFLFFLPFYLNCKGNDLLKKQKTKPTGKTIKKVILTVHFNWNK